MTNHVAGAPESAAQTSQPLRGDESHANAPGNGSGVEKDRSVTVTVNGTPLMLMNRTITGADLKAKAGIPSEYELYVVHGNATKAVLDSDVLHVHEGSAFRAIPAGTFGCAASSAQLFVRTRPSSRL